MRPIHEPDFAVPLAYFITFSCYGTHLHGEDSEAVDRAQNATDSPRVGPNPSWRQFELSRMTQQPFELGPVEREATLAAMREVCIHRSWTLIAAHVRTNHVHVVVQAVARPERIMNDFKVYASRALNRFQPSKSDRKRWTRHGSTKYLWSAEDLEAAIQYVVEEQGQPLALYVLRRDLEL